MKKILVVLLALSVLCLCFAGCTPAQTPTEVPTETATEAAPTEAAATATTAPQLTPTPAPTPKQNITVSEGVAVVDFEGDLSGIQFGDLTQWGFFVPEGAGPLTEETYKGQGFEIPIDGDPIYGVLNVYLHEPVGTIADGFANVGDAQYLRLFVNNVGDSDVSICAILVANGVSGVPNPENAIFVTRTGEVLDTYTSDAAGVAGNNGTPETHVYLPAGFEGWVYFPLYDQVKWWERTTIDAASVPAINQVNLDIRFADVYNAEYIIFDDMVLADPEINK